MKRTAVDDGTTLELGLPQQILSGRYRPQDLRGSLLDHFERFRQCGLIALIEVDVIAGAVFVSSPIEWQTTKATASASVSRTVLLVFFRRSPL